MRKLTKKTLAVATAIALLGGGGVAFAYWTTSGSGTGTAATTAGTVDALTFDQTAVTAMFPGDSSQTLTVEVTNDGSEKAYVTNVKAFITTDKAGCTGADFLLGGSPAPITALTATALTWVAADLAVGGFADATSTIQFNNTVGNQNACKSAVVTVNYVAS